MKVSKKVGAFGLLAVVAILMVLTIMCDKAGAELHPMQIFAAGFTQNFDCENSLQPDDLNVVDAFIAYLKGVPCEDGLYEELRQSPGENSWEATLLREVATLGKNREELGRWIENRSLMYRIGEKEYEPRKLSWILKHNSGKRLYTCYLLNGDYYVAVPTATEVLANGRVASKFRSPKIIGNFATVSSLHREGLDALLTCKATEMSSRIANLGKSLSFITSVRKSHHLISTKGLDLTKFLTDKAFAQRHVNGELKAGRAVELTIPMRSRLRWLVAAVKGGKMSNYGPWNPFS